MEVAEQYGDQVRFIGMPGLADIDPVLDFIDATGTDGIEHIYDDTGELWAQFGVFQHRSYVLIDDDGSVRTRDYGSLQSDVQELIAG